MRPVLLAWQRDGANRVGSRKTAWRIMRRTLGISVDVFPKAIRHMVATMLYSDGTVPQREVMEVLGHRAKLARQRRFIPSIDQIISQM